MLKMLNLYIFKKKKKSYAPHLKKKVPELGTFII